MEKSTGKNAGLASLFMEELKEIYGAEQHQTMILPLLKKAASSLKLQSVLANHLDHTRDQITRLEEIFSAMGETPLGRQSETILSIGHEGETVISETEKGTATRDAGLIITAQKLEHYEISAYSNLAQLARTLEYDEVLDLLETSLFEEREADELLTALAENYINAEAGRE